ncbi:hypothetical protein [Arthrobacter caoxuetaonis]|uniref:Uncharacterized protein n=1 Tax=Arthrobacter caoxuetaonis TaxID=2886935 RepID=A0A9X1MFY0_9MICC|nr:hypothetical protein [Arthrobacter caoxuetaonis]MCC3299364.1 hypothetical protein [Arthrobacter caoxuetaonis]USQ59143.1 hypothetical protein NF551_18730 [Arthrobacter caoxuetaonis]
MKAVSSPQVPVLEAMAATLDAHAPVRRGNGMVGSTCPNALCREPVFITTREAQNHQTLKVLQALRINPANEERASAELAALLGFGSTEAVPGTFEARSGYSPMRQVMEVA